MKVVHLFNESRAAFGIMQGLLQVFPNVEINKNYYSKGVLIHKKSEDVKASLKNSDIVFMNDSELYESTITENKLWNKVIFYDYRDDCNLRETAAKLADTYFKRSLFKSKQRIPMSYNRKIIPLAHCALQEYFVDVQKTKNIGCFFDMSNKNLGNRRTQVLNKLLESDFENSLIGKSTGYANKLRLAISNQQDKNPFFEFLQLQASCKIIFTAQPELVDGDNRTWEALASGSLVFCERPMIPIENELIDGIHCNYFNSNDEQSLNDAIDKARYYLNNDEERVKIAKAGLEFVIKNHMPINRVKYMLKKFNKVKFI